METNFENTLIKMFLSLTLEPLSIRFRTTDGSVEEVVVDVANGFVSKQFDVIRPGGKNSLFASLVVLVLSFVSFSVSPPFVTLYFVEFSIVFVVHSGSKLVSLKEKSNLGSKRTMKNVDQIFTEKPKLICICENSGHILIIGSDKLS